jgi:MFS family permease
MTSTSSLLRNATGRREGLVLMLGSSLTIMGGVMIAPVLPKLNAELGSHSPNIDVLLPLVVAGPALAIALSAPFAGWLADRVGRKALLIVATLLYTVLGALPALLDDLTAIVISRLLFGCAEAAIMTCCSTLIADYWEGEERMRFLNYQMISIGVVGALLFVIGGALGEHSWRTPFFLYLLPLLLLPAMLKVLWEPAVRKQAVSETSEKVSIPTLVIGYLLIFGGMLFVFIAPVQCPVLMVSMGIDSSTLIGLCAGVGLVATLIGSLLWPFFRSQLGIRGCNALLLFLLALGLWLLGSAQSYNAVMLAIGIHGIGAGLLVPNAMAPVMNALSAGTRGRGLGIFTACLYIGQFASPLVVLTLGSSGYDLRGAMHWLAAASLIAALSWALVALIRPDRHAINSYHS